MTMITTKEAAELSGEPIRTIQRWAENKKIKSKKRDNKYLVSREDVLSLSPSRKMSEDATDNAPKERQKDDKETTKKVDDATQQTVGSYTPPPGYKLVDTEVWNELRENLRDTRKQQQEILDKVLNLKAIPANVDATMARQATTTEVNTETSQEVGEKDDNDATDDVKMTRQDSDIPFGSKKLLYWIVGGSVLGLGAIAVIIFYFVK